VFAGLGRLGYCDFAPPAAARLNAALSGLGFGARALFEDRGVNSQALAAVDARGAAVVAFRGTESTSWVDLATDATIWPMVWPGGGRVRGGFGGATGGPRGGGRGERRRDWLDAAGPRAVVATGHSLGAALATLFAADHPQAGLVTFGSPRVGTAGFAARFEGREARRWRDTCDIVTRVAPEWIGFRHLGILRYIDRDGRVHEAPSDEFIRADMVEARAQYVRLATAKWSTVKARGLADHAPINYVSAVLGIRRATDEA